VRLLIGLATTVLLSIVLVVFARLGASWPVVVVGAVGTGLALRLTRLSRRRALALLLVVGSVGLVGIEVINDAQYGTLSLSGPPANVTWCGDTYWPSGAVTHGLGSGAGDGTPLVQILTTPAAYSVYGTYAGQAGESCGATGPLLVQVGPGEYKIYNP